ncbi:hypothetical protein D9M68_766630 [compost metagenome]
MNTVNALPGVQPLRPNTDPSVLARPLQVTPVPLTHPPVLLLMLQDTDDVRLRLEKLFVAVVNADELSVFSKRMFVVTFGADTVLLGVTISLASSTVAPCLTGRFS